MKTILNFINEFTSLIVPSTGVYYRKQMPQLRDINGFIDSLKAMKVKARHSKVKVKVIKPSQIDFNFSKIRGMMGVSQDKLKHKKFVISSDNYLLDGHHRVLALLNQNPDTQVEVIRLSIPRDAMIRYAKVLGKVEYKDVHEMVESYTGDIDPISEEFFNFIENGFTGA